MLDHKELKYKGDLATAAVIFDLTQKGFNVFTPAFTEGLAFDLIAHKDEKLYRIQVKYQKGEESLIAKNGSERDYGLTDFDYYGIYIASINKIIYPSIKFKNLSIRTSIPDTAFKFFWWEDFIYFTDTAPKRTCIEFGKPISESAKIKRGTGTPRPYQAKPIPDKEELEILVWEKPAEKVGEYYNVSAKIVRKWAKKLNIEMPTRQYWNQLYYGKTKPPKKTTLTRQLSFNFQDQKP